MATTSSEIPTRETATGKHGQRPDRAMKMVLSVAILSCAAVLAFAVLQKSDTAPDQAQAVPASSVIHANTIDQREQPRGTDQKQVPGFSDRRFLEWNTIFLPSAASDTVAAPFVPDQFTYREDHRAYPSLAPTVSEYVPDFWTYREDRRER